MADRIFDVTIITERHVRVRVPDDFEGDDPEDIAEEFALGGKGTWPDYVISEDGNSEVDSVVEVETKD